MAPVARVAVAVGARLGRRFWKKMGEKERQAVKDAIKKRTGYILGGCGVASACAIGYYFAHVEEAPVTKRERFMIVNRQEMVDMIEQDKGDIISLLTQGHKVLPASHPAYSQVLPILNRIIPVMKNHWKDDINKIQWTLYIIDSPATANAVCLPTGEIFVYSGLLKICKNQDELAFILAHEVAHILMNHGGENFTNKGLMDLLLLFVIASLWLVIPSDAIAYFAHKWSNSLAEVLFQLPYSRQLEEEADMVGLMLLSSACFTPQKSIEIWNHFPSADIFIFTPSK